MGCGEGHLAHHLLHSGPRPERFEACDISLSKVSAELDSLIHFREASVYDLPYADSEFELVVCCEVLEHLENPVRGLSELARVTKGAVIGSIPESLSGVSLTWRGASI